MIFFKKKQGTEKKNATNLSKTNPPKPAKNLAKTSPKTRLLNEDLLDNRLYEFTHKIKNLTKDDASATLLARQLSRLIKADKF